MKNEKPEIYRELESENTDNVQKKDYFKPLLTHYGGIAELVKMLNGIGPDGNPVPPLSAIIT